MNQIFRLGLWAGLMAAIFLSTGCARTTSTKKRVNALEAQVGVLTDEIARLDQQLQESRGARGTGAGASYAGGRPVAATAIYRTPSGFELPSRDIQSALKGAGYYQGSVDGKIGPGTKDAIKAFQRDHGLNADGVVGRQTWEKLKTYLSGSTN